MGKKCAVKGCLNIKNLSSCKSAEQYKLWKRTINYTGNCNQYSFYICLKHFSPSQSYRDLQQELLGTNRRRRLLPTAVPDTDLNDCDTFFKKENDLSDNCATFLNENVPSQENSINFGTLHKTSVPESNLPGFKTGKKNINEISTQADTAAEPLIGREGTVSEGTTVRRVTTLRGATAIGGASTVGKGTTVHGGAITGGGEPVLGGKIEGTNNQCSLLPSSTSLDTLKRNRRQCAVKGCLKQTSLAGCTSEEQYVLWKKAINYSGKRSQQTFKICLNHFSKPQFCRDLREELLGFPKRFRRLLPTAVPDINLNACATLNKKNVPGKKLSDDALLETNDSDSTFSDFQTEKNKVNEISSKTESEPLLDERTVIGGGTTVGRGTTFGRGTTIGKGTTVGGGATVVRGTTVGGGATVVRGTTFGGGTTVSGGTTNSGGTTIVGGTTVGGGITIMGGTTAVGGMNNQCLLIPLSLTTLDNSKSNAGSSGVLDHKIFYTVVPMPPQLLQNPCTQRQHVQSELSNLKRHKQREYIKDNAPEPLEDRKHVNNVFEPFVKIETSSESLNFDKFGHLKEEKNTLTPLDKHLDNPTNSETLEHIEDEEIENAVIKPSVKIEAVDVDFTMEDLEDPIMEDLEDPLAGF